MYVEMANEEFQSRATRLNFIFNHNITTGNPLIALKLAESTNGMLAEVKGQPSRITEDEARADMMNWRRLFPAICVGSGTLLTDNPSLTARLPEETFCPFVWYWTVPSPHWKNPYFHENSTLMNIFPKPRF